MAECVHQLNLQNFGSVLLGELSEQRRRGHFCDVLVRVQGTSGNLRAHRCVLAAGSPFFQDKLLLGYSQVEIPCVASPNSVARLLDFMYSGVLRFPHSEALQILTAASVLQIKSVIDECTRIVSQSCSVSNSVGSGGIGELTGSFSEAWQSDAGSGSVAGGSGAEARSDSIGVVATEAYPGLESTGEVSGSEEGEFWGARECVGGQWQRDVEEEDEMEGDEDGVEEDELVKEEEEEEVEEDEERCRFGEVERIRDSAMGAKAEAVTTSRRHDRKQSCPVRIPVALVKQEPEDDGEFCYDTIKDAEDTGSIKLVEASSKKRSLSETLGVESKVLVSADGRSRSVDSGAICCPFSLSSLSPEGPSQASADPQYPTVPPMSGQVLLVKTEGGGVRASVCGLPVGLQASAIYPQHFYGGNAGGVTGGSGLKMYALPPASVSSGAPSQVRLCSQTLVMPPSIFSTREAQNIGRPIVGMTTCSQTSTSPVINLAPPRLGGVQTQMLSTHQQMSGIAPCEQPSQPPQLHQLLLPLGRLGSTALLPCPVTATPPIAPGVGGLMGTAGGTGAMGVERKPYACTLCYKTFTAKQNYVKHMFVHTGEKPHQCGVCWRSFSLKDYLIKHMVTHTGVRAYQCTVCNKRFTQKSSLNVHMRLHRGERSFSCPACSRKFSHRSLLERHAATHALPVSTTVDVATCSASTSTTTAKPASISTLTSMVPNTSIVTPALSDTAASVLEVAVDGSNMAVGVSPTIFVPVTTAFTACSGIMATVTQASGNVPSAAHAVEAKVKAEEQTLTFPFRMQDDHVEIERIDGTKQGDEVKRETRIPEPIFSDTVRPLNCTACPSVCLSTDALQAHLQLNLDIQPSHPQPTKPQFESF